MSDIQGSLTKRKFWWRSPFLAQVVLLSISFSVLYFQTIVKLIKDWMADPNFSHGFLIPPVAAYMIWQKRDTLSGSALTPTNKGLFLLAMGMFLHLVGTLGAELFLKRISMIVTLSGLSLYLLGTSIAKKIVIPICYLFLMIPIPAIVWNKIAFPMQLFASSLSFQVINLMGITVLREGNILHLAQTTLEVADACSGLRSLTSLLALSAAFAYLVPIGRIGKWVLFLSAMPIAIIVNIFRLTLTAIMAQVIGPETAQGFLHELSGLLVFILAFVLLLGVYSVLDRINKKGVPEKECRPNHG